MVETLQFVKYHGLGNDYLVIDPQDVLQLLTPGLIRYICDRHYGAGSDGILLGPLDSQTADFGLKIFNPDGSQAEKSGNGLRIFARYLWEHKRVGTAPFTVETPGGIVTCRVFADDELVEVEMGRASFASDEIPVSGPSRQVIDECMQVGDQELRFCALSLGNPHCVVLCEQVDEELARKLGPLIENHSMFPKRTNVQFMQVLDAGNVRIEIWERGAGYTLASGSSSCAAVRAAQVLGWCSDDVTVHMPGGRLQVRTAIDGMLILTGPVRRVIQGWLDLRGLHERAF